MLLKNYLTSFGLILLLSNCSTPEEVVVVKPQYIQRSIPIQARPAPVELTDVKWYVATEDTIDDFLEKFRTENGPVAFMAVSVQGYENIALNVEELRRYILQQKQTISYYEKMAAEPAPK